MMFRIATVIFFSLLSTPSSWALGKKPLTPIDTAQRVDLSQYIGKWYEVARLPQSFEDDCVGVTAEYSLRDDGKVEVLNTCHKHSCDAPGRTARGTARVIDHKSCSKLKVSFFWPFEGDYWILELDPAYRYAVVGSPDRKSFWILSRSSKLPSSLVDSIVAHFGEKGFDLSSLIRTQPCE